MLQPLIHFLACYFNLACYVRCSASVII
uniref:Uncharacterized protein n=1 Tax=Anguilla anguilla TaxID=7936 RepID=A0A0E9WRL6_ANGAN